MPFAYGVPVVGVKYRCYSIADGEMVCTTAGHSLEIEGHNEGKAFDLCTSHKSSFIILLS